MTHKNGEHYGPSIAFRKVFSRVTGDACAALFLSECAYWSSVNQEREGWFYKRQQEWEEDTALSRREQEHSRRLLLRLKLIEEKRMGKNGSMHFRVHWRNLDAAIQECTKAPNRNVQNEQSGGLGMAESAKPECTKAPNRNVQNEQSLSSNNDSTKTLQNLPQQEESETEGAAAADGCLTMSDSWLVPSLLGMFTWAEIWWAVSTHNSKVEKPAIRGHIGNYIGAMIRRQRESGLGFATAQPPPLTPKQRHEKEQAAAARAREQEANRTAEEQLASAMAALTDAESEALTQEALPRMGAWRKRYEDGVRSVPVMATLNSIRKEILAARLGITLPRD